MTKKRHTPPSRIRYVTNHPTVSVRMPKKWKEDFDKFLKKNHMSSGDFFRIAFKKQQVNNNKVWANGYSTGKQEGNTEGYEKAKKEFRIWYYCSLCNKEIDLLPNSKTHQAMIEYMKENGWGHRKCHKQRQNQGVQAPYNYKSKYKNNTYND